MTVFKHHLVLANNMQLKNNHYFDGKIAKRSKFAFLQKL